jgi:hypothetical protein
MNIPCTMITTAITAIMIAVLLEDLFAETGLVLGVVSVI